MGCGGEAGLAPVERRAQRSKVVAIEQSALELSECDLPQ